MKAQIAYVGPQQVGAAGERNAAIVQLLVHPSDAGALPPRGSWVEFDTFDSTDPGGEYFPRSDESPK